MIEVKSHWSYTYLFLTELSVLSSLLFCEIISSVHLKQTLQMGELDLLLLLVLSSRLPGVCVWVWNSSYHNHPHSLAGVQ